MKTLKDLRKEVDSALKGKVKDALEAFQSQRDNDFQELESLHEQLEKFQDQKKELLETQGVEAKKFIPSQKILNECSLKMPHVEKVIRETEKKINSLFKTLTACPETIKEIYSYLKLIQG
jgi:cell division septum initiation protein DivIVA